MCEREKKLLFARTATDRSTDRFLFDSNLFDLHQTWDGRDESRHELKPKLLLLLAFKFFHFGWLWCRRTSVTIWRVSNSVFAFVSSWRTASWLFIIISCVVAVEPNRKRNEQNFESNLVWLWRWRWMDVSDAHWSLSRAQIKIKIVKFVAHRIILFLVLLLCLCLLLWSSVPASSVLVAVRLFSLWWMGKGAGGERWATGHSKKSHRNHIRFAAFNSLGHAPFHLRYLYFFSPSSFCFSASSASYRFFSLLIFHSHLDAHLASARSSR